MSSAVAHDRYFASRLFVQNERLDEIPSKYISPYALCIYLQLRGRGFTKRAAIRQNTPQITPLMIPIIGPTSAIINRGELERGIDCDIAASLG